MKSIAKFGAFLVVFSCVFALCACSSTSNTGEQNNGTQEQKALLSLDGKWKQSNSSSEDTYMEATIEDDVITINWVMDNGKTESIYWVGSFPKPDTTDDSYDFTSERDKEKTESALLASMDDTKDFSYSNGVLSYKASMMGTTTTVELSRE